jgi:hypothetical protein
MGFMSEDIQPRAPVASSTASAMLPVLFCGSLSAAMISSGDNAAAGRASSRAVKANTSAAAREGKNFIYVILMSLSMEKWYTVSPSWLRNLRRRQ